jgi:YD repeat-containing protein
MTVNAAIGIKGWQNYSSFALFSSSSQRADRPHNLFINTYEGNLTLLATDVSLQARVTPSISRAYNSLDTSSGYPRPFGMQFVHNLDEAIIGNLSGGSGTVTHKDASGNEWDYAFASTASGYDTYTTPRGLKTVLKRDTTSGNFELTSGKLKFTFELDYGVTMALLTKIEDKYGNALKIVRVQSNNKPTVQISHVDVRYYDVSASNWVDKQVMSFNYVTGTDLIQTIVLDDTGDSSNPQKFVYLHYTYSSGLLIGVHMRNASLADIASNPGVAGSDLNSAVEYSYSNGLLEYVYDPTACVAGTSANNNDSWYIAYSGTPISKVASVRYRNADTGTTSDKVASTSYDYNVTTGLPFTKLNANDQVTKLTDGEGRYWWYEHESESIPNDWKNGRVVRTADPLYDDSTNQNDVQYTWNSDHNLTEVKTWEPNAGTNQISTKYYYNADKNLEVVQDALGFLTFYKYDTANSKPNNLIETYTQQSGQIVTTVAPGSPDISDVLTDVDGYYYNDATTPTAQKIRLVKTTMAYTANDDLATVATPLGSTTTYNYDSTIGDMTWVKDPMQTNDANLGRTDYAYDETYGVVTTVTNALSEVTTYTYDTACVRRTKVELPLGSSYYTSYEYDRRWYLTGVKRPDPATGTTPEVTLTTNTYDYNGNLTEVAIPDVWNSGSFTSRQFVYDRLNRLAESKVNVNLQGGGGRQYLTTKYGYDRVNNRLWAKDPDDYVSLTDYDDANRAVRSYQPFQDANAPSGTPPTYSPPGGTPYAEFTLDKLGNTITATDMNGNDTDYTYDVLSRAVQVDRDYTDYSTSPPSTDTVTTKTVFDSAGLTYNTENGRGKKMFFEYDDDGRKVKNIRLDRTTGDYDETEYNLNGAVSKYYDFESVADSKSYWTEYKYDALNRTVNVMDNEGNWLVADTEFDANGNVTKRYDRVNASGTYFTAYTYDYWGRQTRVEFPQVKDKNGNNVIYDERYVYNVLGMRTSARDRNANTTNYDYDEWGRILLVTLPGGTYTTSTRYTNRGFVDHTIATTGAYTRYTYDAAGRRTRVRLDHDSGTLDDTDYTYDDNGNVTQIDYPDGGQTKYTYDELNRRIKQEALRTSPSTYITTEYAYSKTNKVTLIKLPTGQNTTYTYTDLDLVDTVTAPGSFATAYTYDLQNRTVSVTDPDGLITEYGYNTNGWTTTVTNKVDGTPANDIVVEYGYDDNGARTSETDPLGNQYDREYDAMGRNTKITAPLVTGQISRKEDLRYFDGNGNVVKVTDFKAAVTNYVYNALNQRSSMGWGASSNDVVYSWNCCRVTGYADASGPAAASLAYDQLARLTSFTDTQNNQVQYTYDSMSRVTQLTDHTGSSTVYNYDKRGGVTRITTPSGNTDYTHDTAGRVDTRTYANNLKTGYTYDTAGRVSQMKFENANTLPPTLIEQYDYTYTGLAASYARIETNAAVRYAYSFDKLRRMTNETKRGTGGGLPLHYQKDFSYDKAGNRASYQHQNGAGFNYGRAVNYNLHAYDQMGRLTLIQDTARSYTATVTSDWNGNITQVHEVIPRVNDATSTFSYDNENRLTAYAIGASNFSAAHTYDGYNRLVKTDATIGANTQNFEHVYSGKQHLGNIEVTGTPVNGKVWSWETGAGMPNAGPIESPQRYSASSTQFYMVSDERNIQKKSYRVASVTAGDYNDDSRYAKWQQVNGNVTPCRMSLSPYYSELFSAYDLTLDADRASSASTNHALQLAASDLEYEGTRVKSPSLGRDLNPMGRGDGTYYADGGNTRGGSVAVGRAKPALVGIVGGGYGSSINNYDSKACEALRAEWQRKIDEGCLKTSLSMPISCCQDACGWDTPDEATKRDSCECCCCLSEGCGCIPALPKECIFCCHEGEECKCMEKSGGCKSCSMGSRLSCAGCGNPGRISCSSVPRPGMWFVPIISMMIDRGNLEMPLSMTPYIPIIHCPHGYQARCEFVFMPFFGLFWWQCWCVPNKLPKPPNELDLGDTTGLDYIAQNEFYQCIKDHGAAWGAGVSSARTFYYCVIQCSGLLWPILLTLGQGGTLESIRRSAAYGEYVACMQGCLGCLWPSISTGTILASALCAIQTGLLD